MATATTHVGAPTFLDTIVAITPGEPHLNLCIQCGTCGGSCPSGPDMDHTPRSLFALIAAGMKEKALSSNAPWYCVSCYYCMVRCPQDVHVTDLMYSLKRLSLREGYAKKSDIPTAPGFSQTFITFVENYGRSYEFGMVIRYAAVHPTDALKLAPLGFGLFTKTRIAPMPKRIKGIDSLKAILNRAKELEEDMYKELEV